MAKRVIHQPRVFVSYSHKDKQWMELLLLQLRVLEMESLLDAWVDTRIETGNDWYPEIEQAMIDCGVAILLVTADFLTSNFIRLVEVPTLLQRRAKEGIRIYPVICEPCPWKKVDWLSRMQVKPENGESLSGKSDHDQKAELAIVATEIADYLTRAHRITIPGKVFNTQPDKVHISKLPQTSPDLFGREKELEVLDKAWVDGKTNVVSVVAWGGVGKSALVNHWLKQRMLIDGWRGAELVYGWSFYHQETIEESQAQSEFFVNDALNWFGDGPREGESTWQKGRRLAELVRGRRVLLVLDGLEPLQQPSDEHGGTLRDLALQCLIGDLAADNQGMCIITTRCGVAELSGFAEPFVVTIPLEHLPDEAGAQLLLSLGVDGELKELKQASQDFAGHALALRLLGNYVKTVWKGHIHQRDRVPPFVSDRNPQSAHARRVMQGYEQWFEGKPELEILYMMGLFNKPAEEGAVKVIRTAPAINGLTNGLSKLSDAHWKNALAKLRTIGLISEENRAHPDELDCHPLVRDFFAARLQSTSPTAFMEAHSRLYDYYSSLPVKDLPDTLDEMAPLYVAIQHGCAAGRGYEALHETYLRRIGRDKEFYGIKKLGALGAELAAILHFFDEPWDVTISSVEENAKGRLLLLAGYCLKALG